VRGHTLAAIPERAVQLHDSHLGTVMWSASEPIFLPQHRQRDGQLGLESEFLLALVAVAAGGEDVVPECAALATNPGHRIPWLSARA
jgi:hypothetical protein